MTAPRSLTYMVAASLFTGAALHGVHAQLQPVEPLPRADEVVTEIVVEVPESPEPEFLALPDAPTLRQREDMISISLDEVELQDVVRMFTRISGANIIANPTNLVGKVSANLTDVHWRLALQTILRTHQLILVEKDPDSNIYSIETRAADAPEPLEVETLFLNYASVGDVQRAIEPVLGERARLSPFPTRNALVIKTTADNMREIKAVVETIDRMREQVFIEAKFLELNDSAIQNLGINWQALEGLNISAGNLAWTYEHGQMRQRTRDQIDSRYSRQTESDLIAPRYGADGSIIDETSTTFIVNPITGEIMESTTGQTPVRTYDNLRERGRSSEYEARDRYERTIDEMRTAVLGMDDFRVVLSALRQTAGVTVVSNPKIIVANEETASIHIGETERPFVSTVTPATDSSAPFTTYNPGEPVEFGVKLDVTPTVNTASNISLVISPTLTRFVRDVIAPTGQSYPVIARKSISTRFTLEDGKTVAIGGLTETRDRENVSKVPLLGDIPLIGRYLFTHTRKERGQTETIIFVTVGMASPGYIRREQGLPEDTQLTQRHMLQQQMRRAEYERSLDTMRETVERALAPGEQDPEIEAEVRRVFGR